jgi:hypothetical protein
MKIINIENGNFTLNSKMALKANQNFDEVNNFNIHKTTSDMGNGYEWIYFKNLKIENLYFFLNICFLKHEVKFITFTFSHSDSTNRSWNDWVEVDEEKESQKLEDWLNETVGLRREFSWGKISSNYDSKGGGSSILINYN